MKKARRRTHLKSCTVIIVLALPCGSNCWPINSYTSFCPSKDVLRKKHVKHVRRQRTQDRQCTYNVILRRVRANIVAVEKQRVLHKLSVCVFAFLIIQHAMRMRHFIICVPPDSTRLFCFISQRHNFRKKCLKYNVFFFFTTFFKHFTF